MEAPTDGRPRVLLHGVSLGEINATRTLVEALAAGPTPAHVVVSSTTNTGFDRAQTLYEPAHSVVRFPFDFSFAIRRFLDRVRPDVVVLMELEVWPNLLAACSRRGIPVCVVNGRLSANSFRSYRRVRPLVRGTFARLTAVTAQTEPYAERFAWLGTPAERVRVTDTMKWDTAPSDPPEEAADALRREMRIDPDRPLVVAGSTGPGEERLLLEGKPDGVQLLVAPRKPERFDDVAKLATWERRSRPGGGATGSELFLLDSLGELRAAYALADVVVVGRSFNGLGGSDPIEAAALGKPIVMGPDHHNFQHVVDALRVGGGLRVVDDPWPEVQALLSGDDGLRGDAAVAVVRGRQGATERNADVVRRLLDEKLRRQTQPPGEPLG